jgi:hypothetical protein
MSEQLAGHAVVEVHLIMQPLHSQLRGQITSSTSSASWAGRFLTYVQRLDVMSQRHGSLLQHTTLKNNLLNSRGK